MNREAVVLQFARKLATGRFPVSLEITPPRSRRPDILTRRARLLGDRADAVNVIQRPDRMSSLEACLILRREGLDPIWHVVTRGRERAEVAREIDEASRGGIGAVLCIRGDHGALDKPDTPKLRDVVEMVRMSIPDALIGVTMNQAAAPERVLRNLVPKLRAGAGFVQTQPLFALSDLRPLGEEVKSRAPETRIVPMVMPLASLDAAKRVRERLGVNLPPDLLSRLDAKGEEAGWAAFDQILHELSESPLADGIAIMTLGMDPPAPFAERIVSALDRMRARGASAASRADTPPSGR